MSTIAKKNGQALLGLLKYPEYRGENLVFNLTYAPFSEWVDIFKNQPPTTTLQFPKGQELVNPHAFIFANDLAMLPIQEAIFLEIDAIILWNIVNMFVTYLNEANSLYSDFLANKGHQ